MAAERAVVLLSGGLDSATALAWARERGYDCHALSVAYGQRHRAELDAAERVAHSLGAVAHRVLKVDLGALGGSALTDTAIAVPEGPRSGIPVTYVPARNTVLLALALAWAEVLEARHLVIGVNAVDYSGYPDCRPEFIDAFAHLARIATRAGVEGRALQLHAPLLYWSKARIIQEGHAARRRLRAHRVLLPGGRGGPGVRPLRILPVAPRRIRRGGCRRSDPLRLR